MRQHNLRVTGSLSINGENVISASELSVLSASIVSRIEGLNPSQIGTGSYTASISSTGGFNINTTTTITGSLFVSNLSGSGVNYVAAISGGQLIAISGSNAILNTERFVATAGQTVFNSSYGYLTGLVQVYYNGTKLDSTEFSDINGSTITLTTGSNQTGDIVELVTFRPVSGVEQNALRTKTSFTASASQTTFLVDYTPGLIDVYFNGSHLASEEYTANNGTSIVLTEAATGGEVIDIFVYNNQIGAFSGIGGGGEVGQFAYFSSQNGISGSSVISISGSSIIAGGSIIPAVSGAYDLGSSSNPFRHIYVGTGSIYLVDNSGQVTNTISAQTIVTTDTLASGTIDLTDSLPAGTVSSSAQVVGILSSLNSYTSSINSLTSSLATTGSNTFIGTQIFSGSLFVQDNLVVQGSSSLQNITASAVSIGTNTVLLNTANPSVRYGGISVIDSGSASGKSGSLYFDSTDDEWVFVHQGNVSVTSSIMITGPETYDNIGNEIRLTTNTIPKVQSGFHLYDSCITDNGDTICFNTPTGSFSGKLGIGASNPRWALEICTNNGCTAAGQYPAISINNGCTTGYSGLYFYNGINQMGGVEASNSTGNISLNGGTLSLNTATNPRLSIANTGAVTISCQLYLDGCNRDTVFVKSDNTNFSRLFYAGQNSVVFHNGGTTANGGNWGLNNYEDTAALFRVFNSGKSCWYGDKMVCGNIGINCTSAKFYQLTNNCKSADSVLDIYNTATNGYGVAVQAGALNNNYALSVSNYAGTGILYVAGNGYIGINCNAPNAKLTINNGSCVNSINIYGSNSSYISQIGWFDSTNNDPVGDGVGGQRVALIEIQTVAGGAGCRGANMALYTHQVNGSLKLPLLLMNNGNVCLPQGNLYTTCTLFAPGTPIQVVTGTAVATSGPSGNNASLGPTAGGSTPGYNCGCLITSVSFTPKSASSKILIQTNTISLWETANVADHFYLWASNDSAGTVLAKSGGYVLNLGQCTGAGTQGAIINLNGAANSWGTSANTISFRIGTSGGAGNYYQWNPYYGVGGFSADTVGNFSYTIMEIAQ
jgi:hypothetical protein